MDSSEFTVNKFTARERNKICMGSVVAVPFSIVMHARAATDLMHPPCAKLRRACGRPLSLAVT